MTHQEKLEAMYRHMVALGVSKGTAAPPAWRLLWRFGLETPPPMFASFASIALATGGFFGVFWGLAMWALLWARQGMPLPAMLAAAVGAGVFFGLAMAAYYRHLARKHRLPGWPDYRGAPGPGQGNWSRS